MGLQGLAAAADGFVPRRPSPAARSRAPPRNARAHLPTRTPRPHPALPQTPTDKEWFQGTADAVRQYAWLLDDTKNRSVKNVVILSGDHL